MTDAEFSRSLQIVIRNLFNNINETLDRRFLHRRLYEITQPKCEHNLRQITETQMPRRLQIITITLPNICNETLDRGLLHHRLDEITKPKCQK